ncbi:RNA polymerase sigma-70 factor, sigma-E family [Sinosporangium album]|uniref:RNA polymerase sigma-70 factor, sigma-E family n=1 Tax=Sinosporangium album TaxID=504805 RepID=A0A1G7UGM9_9ACTN|nr:SigE family RNA polymerase sigma factor [Sinosporangium album]SDG46702.1 RNA polymerase sigma-70 factor, sigma-E family [Sinosporangium album]
MSDGFADYVAQRHARLCRTAYLLTRDWGTAEDLVQTALAKAWGAWRRIEGDPDPYVYRIIANTHASWWRRRWRGEVPTEVIPDVVESRDFTHEVNQRDALWTAIGGLSRRQRAVVVLHYFEEMTLPQVAEVLGCSLSTVKTQAARALARLRVNGGVREIRETVKG